MQDTLQKEPGLWTWRYWRSPILFIAVMLLFRSAIADWNQVPSASMEPSILIGDRIVVDKLAYQMRIPFTQLPLAQLGEPQIGDVVTFVSPKDQRLLVKRVIARPGDTVEMLNNRLRVNGENAGYALLGRDAASGKQHWRETIGASSHQIALTEHRHNTYQSFPEIKLPPDQFLMLGDNRDNSEDSRVIGLVDRRLLVGRAHHVAFSLDYENFWPRSERFLLPLD